MNKLKAFLTVSASILLLLTTNCMAPLYIEPPPVTKGTTLSRGSLTEMLAWLETNADSRKTYILEVNANENIAPHTFEYKGATDIITIVLRGVGENRTLRLASHGTMFTVKPNVQLILDSNITIMGHSQNTGPMVNVDGGKIWMRSGSSIIGNDRGSGNGGGVYVGSGAFVMTGGVISGNTAENGGGVYVYNTYRTNARIALLGGIISGNTASEGGGVYLKNASLMPFYEIISTSVTDKTSLAHSTATITGNIARKRGGGLYVADGHEVIFLNGYGGLIITGYDSDPDNGNVVKDEGGNIISKMGHAVFWARVYSEKNLRYIASYLDKTDGKRKSSNKEQSDAQTEE